MAELRDNPERHRFELDTEAGPAFVSYRRGDGVITLVHAEVPRAVEGRGIASGMVRAVLDRARAENLKVVPVCPFIRAFIGRHPDYADLTK